MRTSIASLLLVLTLAAPALAGETVTRIIESDVPIVIDGNWIHPEKGVYNIVMTDSNLTVNGYEYVHPEDISLYRYEPPSKEKGFLDWSVRTTVEHAQQIVDSGGSPEDARKYMEDTYAEHADGDTFRYSVDENGYFALFYRDLPLPVKVPVPEHPQRREPRPSYRQRAVEPCFNELCYHLGNGYLIMRGTRDSSFWAFPPAEIELVEGELKNVPGKAKTHSVEGEIRFLPLVIAEKYKLSPSEVRLLVEPQKLIQRALRGERSKASIPTAG
jgi:hypothetical protein